MQLIQFHRLESSVQLSGSQKFLILECNLLILPFLRVSKESKFAAFDQFILIGTDQEN